MAFDLASPFEPAGDQPCAIGELAAGLGRGDRYQTLLGVTGSGKTMTMAHVIARFRRPTLVLSHNKTLAAQLYGELKSFFPKSAVEFFISYYDYYQPEAYVPQTDTYIAKDSSINDDIDRLRLRATSSLMEREDVVIVASVSAIYGLGDPEAYRQRLVTASVGEERGRDALLEALVGVQYQRNDTAFERGTFRVRGDTVEVFPAYDEQAVRVEFWGDTVERIAKIDPLTGSTIAELARAAVYPATHFVTERPTIERAVAAIRAELKARHGALDRRPLGDEVGSRVHRGPRQLRDGAPGEGIDLRDPLYGVTPELDPHRLLVVRREDLDRVPPHPERPTLEGRVVALVLDSDQRLEQGIAAALLADARRHKSLAVRLGVTQAVDRRHARHDHHILALHQARRGAQPQPVDVVIDRRVLRDVRVGLGDVGLGLVVVVIRDEEFDGALREKRFELAVQLGRQGLVVGQHERGASEPGDDVGHGHRLAGAGDAQERLVAVVAREARHELPDGARLIPRRLERGYEVVRHQRKLTDGGLRLGARFAAGHVHHALHPPNRPDHLVQVRLVFDLHQHRAEHRAVARGDLRRADVGARFTDGGADVGIEAPAVLAAHRQSYHEGLSLRFLPVDLDAAFGLGREQEEIGTIRAVDGDTAALGDVSHHQVARHRLAALSIPHHQPVHPLDLDAASQADALHHAAEGRRLWRLELLGGQVGVERAHHGPERDVAPPERGLELLRRPDGQVGRGALQPRGVRRGEAAAPHFPREDFLPELETLLVLLPADPLPDLVAGPRRLHVGGPVAGRVGLGAGHHHGIAVLERTVQRRDAAVDARALAVLADLRMHREREVDRRRSFGQTLHVAAGGEDEDLVLVEVDLQELEELLGRVRVLLQLQQLPEPRQMAVQLVRALAPFFEQPVRRDAVLRGVVHFMGADLDLV